MIETVQNTIPLRIASRDDWRAIPPSSSQDPLPHPITHIRYILNTEVPSCFNDEECIRTIQDMQWKDMNRGLEDIRYNFLIGEEGIVYEGRGWKVKPPRDEEFADMDGKYLEIAFIGDYSKLRFDDKWLEGIMHRTQWALLEYGMENKYVADEPKYIALDKEDPKKPNSPSKQKSSK